MNITLDTSTVSPALLLALALELNDLAEPVRAGAAEAGADAAVAEDVAAADEQTAGDDTTGTQAPATDVELDSAGLPWDTRIHARTKVKVADDTWRKKRGVDDALVAQVEAELRQAMAAPGPAAATTAAAPAAPAAAAPAAPAAPAAAGHPAATMTFPELMQTIATAGVDSSATLAACQKHGLASTALLGTRTDLIPVIYDELFPG